MKRFIRAGLVLALVACNVRPAANESVAAADLFTKEHAARKLRASAAGEDCKVLLIRIDGALDRELVDSLHYGTGEYDAFGGVEQFAQDRDFRAVVYRDSEGELRTYGATTRDEARSLPHCR